MSIIRMSRSRSAAVAVTAAVSVSFLAGCGGTDKTASPSGTEDTGGVASIHKPSAGSSAAAASAERPVIRLDTSPQDRTRLQDVYIDCLLASGFPKQAVRKGPQGTYPGDLDEFDLTPEVRSKIDRDCASKEPEPAIQRAKRLDPQYADHLEANVKCLNQHGVKAVIEDNRPGLVDGLPSESKAHWLDDCEQQAFAKYYSTLK